MPPSRYALSHDVGESQINIDGDRTNWRFRPCVNDGVAIEACVDGGRTNWRFRPWVNEMTMWRLRHVTYDDTSVRGVNDSNACMCSLNTYIVNGGSSPS